MIPAKPNLYAIFTDEYAARKRVMRGEIVAWAESGEPLVQGRTGLELVMSNCIKEILEDEPCEFETYSQLIPVHDLFSLHREESGELYERQLIGWGITTAGIIVAVAEELGDGRLAVSRDDDYLFSFREADRERVYAENSPKPFKSRFATLAEKHGGMTPA